MYWILIRVYRDETGKTNTPERSFVLIRMEERKVKYSFEFYELHLLEKS